MPPIPVWQIVTALGVAGLAVFVFFLVIQRFGTKAGKGIQLSKIGGPGSAIVAVLILIAVTAVTLTALVLFAPRQGTPLISITIQGRAVATALPDTYSSGTRKALGDTLAGIERAVESHDWELFLSFADPENLAFQRSLGVSDAQYIEEALGFNAVFNDLPGEPDPDNPFARLNSIERFDITEVEASDLAAVHVIGVVTLQGRKQRPFSFDLTQYALGAYRFNLPAG